MTWKQIHTELFYEFDRQLREVGFLKRLVNPAQSREHHEARIDAARTYREDIDTACQQFARTGAWPEMSIEFRELVLARIYSAMSFVGLVSAELSEKEGALFFPTAGTTHEQVFDFLLVKYWWHAGFHEWCLNPDRIHTRRTR